MSNPSTVVLDVGWTASAVWAVISLSAKARLREPDWSASLFDP
jgi:hypothetical protein